MWDPSYQPYAGPEATYNDPISNALPVIGQLSPQYKENWMLSHGRYLSGLGLPAGVPTDQEPRRHDGALRELENEDDVIGSGIFDPAGTSTVHSTLGVFADHPSVPGYIARNPPFTVNKDVVDLPSGAQVVEVPGGGMAYVEQGGHLVGPQAFRVPKEGPNFPFHRVPETPSRTTVPMNEMRSRVPQMQTVFPRTHGIPIGPRSLGDDTSTPSWGTYAFAGVVVGVAAAMFVGTIAKKGRR